MENQGERALAQELSKPALWIMSGSTLLMIAGVVLLLI